MKQNTKIMTRLENSQIEKVTLTDFKTYCAVIGIEVKVFSELNDSFYACTACNDFPDSVKEQFTQWYRDTETGFIIFRLARKDVFNIEIVGNFFHNRITIREKI
jgi:hypothetical protein